MTEKMQAKLLTVVGNIGVVQRVDRNYPGILVQGDSMATMLGDLDELISELDAAEHGSAQAIATSIRDSVRTWLDGYEKSLDSHGIELPY